MTRYGSITLALGVALLATSAGAAEPSGALWPQISSRRTAARPVALGARLAAYAGDEEAVEAASPPAKGAVEGDIDYGYAPHGGHGFLRDHSGWGNCDWSAPCTSHLWAGYVQRPHRCFAHKAHFGCNSCAPACDSCGVGKHGRNRYRACDSCSTCGSGFGGFAFNRIFGHYGSCGAPCDSCTMSAPGCASPIEAKPLNAPEDASEAPEPPEPTAENDDNSVFHVPTPAWRSSRPIGSGVR